VSQSITVGDTTAPTISCPIDVLTNTDLGLCTVSNAVLGSPTTSDTSGGHVTVINDAPGTFPTGTNAVVWTATDGCGNSSSCTQQVIVVDREPPTINGCPTNLTVGCASAVPAPDVSSVTATDNCSAVTGELAERHDHQPDLPEPVHTVAARLPGDGCLGQQRHLHPDHHRRRRDRAGYHQ